MKKKEVFSERWLKRLVNNKRAMQRGLDYYDNLLITANADPKNYDIRDIKASIKRYKKTLMSVIKL